MRAIILCGTTFLVFALILAIQAQPPGEAATVKVHLRLVNDRTGKDVAGIVRLFPKGSDVPLVAPELLNRLRGLGAAEKLGWYVVPSGGREVSLPKGALRLEAVAGLETETTRQDVDLSKAGVMDITGRVKFLFRPDEKKWWPGNTHLHLRDLSREEADDYLRQIPAADGLKVLFLSYLERNKDDLKYITNRYPAGALKEFDTTGVLMSNGEEHRHNFEAFKEGYGHVMFLDLAELVKPVSLGPGITGDGNDDRPLAIGMDEARRQEATILWCHNTTGFEALPALLAGRVHALNVYDGSRTGTFEDRYYRLLNVGQRLPISTGTDWFVYDFARAYVRLPEAPTIKTWLSGLRAGRSVATNGPLLNLTVAGREIGDVLAFNQPTNVRIEANALGRHDFEQLELVANGKVIRRQASEKKAGGYSAELVHAVRVTEPTWFAVRIDAKTKNEFDHRLFAHSSPVYVDIAGKRVLEVESARALQREMETARDAIRRRGLFSSEAARDKVLALYEEAEKEIARRLEQRGK